MDIREEEREATTMRIVESLRLYRYKLPADTDKLDTFMRSISNGNKNLIYQILNWLLHNTSDLKKRAYLSRFLCKVKVPTEFLQEDVQDLYEEYEHMIENFKEVHKHNESLLIKGNKVTEIKRDIAEMQDEKEQLTRRLLNLDNTIGVLKSQLMEVRSKGLEQNPESLIQRLEQEVRVNQYMVSETLPTDIQNLRQYLDDLSRVASQPVLTQSYLEDIKSQIHDCSEANSRLIERRLKSRQDMGEDKTTLFKQQATIVANKKASVASNLVAMREKSLKGSTGK
ncbi:Intraflagellar transport protein 81 [Cichlidogyrus casuarinus]|uniref:Intraflagellar transport protein 81 n=1 Tax=Cichlidogyrus casuarinus TaxID=1844966 RepID=A0ABD2Q8D4_9PLAT